jgi:signal transduction histidine kinase
VTAVAMPTAAARKKPNARFDAFYQIKRGAGAKEQGSGLGQSLSRKLVELHGGRMWAESEGEGKGSRFVFTLPFTKA